MRPDVARQQAEITPHEASEHAHPPAREYVVVAVALAIITAAEVLTYYQQGSLHGAIVPILFVLSAVKFLLVAMFFMHLRYDSSFFSAVFSGPLLLAMAVLIALLSIFHRVLLGI
jgi:cytochrome c oxidase subunit 4